jgi:hypothetical protein
MTDLLREFIMLISDVLLPRAKQLDSELAYKKAIAICYRYECEYAHGS